MVAELVLEAVAAKFTAVPWFTVEVVGEVSVTDTTELLFTAVMVIDMAVVVNVFELESVAFTATVWEPTERVEVEKE
jgi:hypothetical protein